MIEKNWRIALRDVVIVVSGIPRAGTSMVMQMLEAGGVSVVTDKVRGADEDNPRGYFEDERVKRLKHDASWIGEAKGKAIKVVTPLILHLPPGLPYRVILIERNLDQALASQAQMLVRRGSDLRDSPDRREKLKAAFAASIGKAKQHVESLPGALLLNIDRKAVLENPLAAARRINDFLGGGLNIERMAAVVDHSLNRFADSSGEVQPKCSAKPLQS
jgi:hypothetical protein